MSFDPNTQYNLYAEAFEEGIMGWEPESVQEVIEEVRDREHTLDADEARKILSELGLDYSGDDDTVISRLIEHYTQPEVAERVFQSWKNA